MIKKRNITHWIKLIIGDFHKKVGDISFIFCSDDEIMTMNTHYLGHNYYTDIITFDYSENDIVSGDLFIAPNIIEYNSKKYDLNYIEEFHRVIIHGILHLCGLNDASNGEVKVMRETENKALRKLNYAIQL